jgi:hypothetical protein
MNCVCRVFKLTRELEYAVHAAGVGGNSLDGRTKSEIILSVFILIKNSIGGHQSYSTVMYKR